MAYLYLYPNTFRGYTSILQFHSIKIKTAIAPRSLSCKQSRHLRVSNDLRTNTIFDQPMEDLPSPNEYQTSIMDLHLTEGMPRFSIGLRKYHFNPKKDRDRIPSPSRYTCNEKEFMPSDPKYSIGMRTKQQDFIGMSIK